MPDHDKNLKHELEEKLYQVVPELEWKAHKGSLFFAEWFFANGYENRGGQPKIKVYVERDSKGIYNLKAEALDNRYEEYAGRIVDEVGKGLFRNSIELCHFFASNQCSLGCR